MQQATTPLSPKLNGTHYDVRTESFCRGLVIKKQNHTSGIFCGLLFLFIFRTVNHFVQCGEFVAKVDAALADFDHAGLRTRDSIWLLSSVPKLIGFTHAIKEEKRRNLVKNLFY